MPKITHLAGHACLLRSNYRETLRCLRKIRPLIPKVIAEEANGSVHSELQKASKNPKLYGELLSTEIRYYIDEEFRKEYRALNSKSLFTKLLKCALLVECLKKVVENPINPHLWTELVKLLVKHRDEQQLRQEWKQDYKKHKTEIDRGRFREIDPLTLKRINSRASKPRPKPHINFENVGSGEQYKMLKSSLARSQENSRYAVRNYLKYLQLNGRIPNPYKLPYVSETLARHSLNLPKLLLLLPGSTKSFVLDEAYDKAYIDAILKPQLEFVVNKNHHMKSLEQLVLEKGPYKVKIRNTTAGVMTANFIRAPNYRPPLMKELALDIKKLMRSVRKQFIWNHDPKGNVRVSEKQYGDGYGVRGSRGHSSEEIMYPRKFYEALVDQESFWEGLMKMEDNKAMNGESSVLSPKAQLSLKKADEENFATWREPLDESTTLVNLEIQNLYEKWKVKKDSPIWQEQSRLQDIMNTDHEKRVEKYYTLLRNLEDGQYFLHSDLFMNRISAANYDTMMQNDSYRRPDKKVGLSEFEKAGLGKQLADYLTEVGMRAYRVGYNFTKKFDFK